MNRVQKVQHRNKIIVKSDLEAGDAEIQTVNELSITSNSVLTIRSNADQTTPCINRNRSSIYQLRNRNRKRIGEF